MKLVRIAATFAGAALLFSACTSSASLVAPTVVAGSLSATVAPPSNAPVTTPSPSPSPSAGGGGSSDTPVPTKIAPCSLLTDAQAGQVNGASYGDGIPHVVGPSALCVWQDAAAKASLTVEVTVSATEAQAVARFAAFRASLATFATQTVTGFASDAFISRATKTPTGGIYVRDGATFFDVVYLQGAVPSDNVLKFAATLILGNLP